MEQNPQRFAVRVHESCESAQRGLSRVMESAKHSEASETLFTIPIRAVFDADSNGPAVAHVLR